MNFADLLAITRSPDSARPTPPPAAIPLTALTTGLFDWVMAFTSGLKAFSMLFAAASPGEIPLGFGHPPSTRSAPEQNPLPLPVSKTDLTSLFTFASLKASKSPRIKSAFIALRTSGLFSLRVRTPDLLRSFSITSFIIFFPLIKLFFCTSK